ncbi:MAG: hypothetical protein UT42_C0046G0010 [Candidatus Falkowbacteria bacterium GW2011_GWA2_39_24]|uniref:ABC transporter substrate-binding protein n=1 Tax=Candidatus Falkowbacteria bacterium GW2011_GWA2_39_24 TaxID=1618634 RepID=A0A0G0RIJ4_9BACT|nr:MAG: hypothetical protein UT42_C0046G0010 [Candidatus Falkowbacteria bacterium GW2011_GWA2_39_24]
MNLRLFFLSIIVALAVLAGCASTDSTTNKTGAPLILKVLTNIA